MKISDDFSVFRKYISKIHKCNDLAMPDSNKILYKAGPILGKAGQFAGFLMIFGILSLTYVGIFIGLIGFFVAFSKDGFEMDFSGKRYRDIIFLFGFFRIGRWKDFSRIEGLFLSKQHITEGAYSRSNRHFESAEQKFILYLRMKNPMEHKGIAIFEKEEFALRSVEMISKNSEIPVLTSLPQSSHHRTNRRK